MVLSAVDFPSRFSLLLSERLPCRDSFINKLAVIHADGNGLGVLVKNLIGVVKKSDDTGAIARFSQAFDGATKKAYENAKEKTAKILGDKNLKIKALILSGDDMTAVCDADIALEFTKNFIEETLSHFVV